MFKKISACTLFIIAYGVYAKDAPRKKSHLQLEQQADFEQVKSEYNEDDTQALFLEPKHHEMIYLKKITNASSQPVFSSFEQAMLMPLGETISLAGHIVSGNTLESHDPDGKPQAVLIPEWQRSFRGNRINVVALAGNPGRIYYLYVINGHLWALLAPNKEGELKGIHLLAPSEHKRDIELVVKDNAFLEINVLDEKDKDAS